VSDEIKKRLVDVLGLVDNEVVVALSELPPNQSSARALAWKRYQKLLFLSNNLRDAMQEYVS
jgi:hypothetical protein